METTQTLIRNAQTGDRRALEKLYERYLVPLQRWAHGRLPAYARELNETSDLVQDTVLRSLRSLARFEARRDGAFLAYLKTGVLHRLRDEIRKAMRRSGRRPSEPQRVCPLQEAIGRETLRSYERALERLQPMDRELIIGRVELGLGYRELAAAVDKPSADAARVALKRALLRLAQEMANEG